MCSLKFWLNDGCLGEVYGQILPILGEVYTNIYVKQIFEIQWLNIICVGFILNTYNCTLSNKTRFQHQ